MLLHPRRPRGSQSGREKMRDESLQAWAEEPLGTPDHFQMVKRMLAPDWAQKMLCIIMPNQRTASPETSRDRVNSRRVRTHEKNSGETVRRLGTIIQSIFCAQSGASIRLTVWKWSGESRYPGALPPMLVNFRRAFSPGPTDRPWVFEDVVVGARIPPLFPKLLYTARRSSIARLLPDTFSTSLLLRKNFVGEVFL